MKKILEKPFPIWALLAVLIALLALWPRLSYADIIKLDIPSTIYHDQENIANPDIDVESDKSGDDDKSQRSDDTNEKSDKKGSDRKSDERDREEGEKDEENRGVAGTAGNDGSDRGDNSGGADSREQLFQSKSSAQPQLASVPKAILPEAYASEAVKGDDFAYAESGMNPKTRNILYVISGFLVAASGILLSIGREGRKRTSRRENAPLRLLEQ